MATKTTRPRKRRAQPKKFTKEDRFSKEDFSKKSADASAAYNFGDSFDVMDNNNDHNSDIDRLSRGGRISGHSI
jgi:hypothetical protein